MSWPAGDMSLLNRSLAIEIARVTEAAAIAAARWRGRGDEREADRAAAGAMRAALDRIDMDGVVVIGEGESGEAAMLYVGEKLGCGAGAGIDIALDPLEGTTLCAKAMPNALAVLAIAQGGSLLHAPDTYMDKIAIGAVYARGTVDLDLPPEENIKRLAREKGVAVADITACVLDRPRHAELIAALRQVGCAVRLIGDGDVAGIIDAANAAETGIDIYLGIGGAPEGVLAAAALRCIGGQMQGRLVARSAAQKERAAAKGIRDFDRKYALEDMASGDVMFSATGVTDGTMLAGVRFGKEWIETHSLVMRSATGTLRWIRNRQRIAAP